MLAFLVSCSLEQRFSTCGRRERWAAGICLVGREQGWELVNFYHFIQETKTFVQFTKKVIELKIAWEKLKFVSKCITCKKIQETRNI